MYVCVRVRMCVCVCVCACVDLSMANRSMSTRNWQQLHSRQSNTFRTMRGLGSSKVGLKRVQKNKKALKTI